MITGKTKSGFQFAIPKRVMNNMELVDLLADDTEDETMKVSRILRLVMTKEQRQRFYDHHREPDGRVPVEKIYEELGEIFLSFQQGKNS